MLHDARAASQRLASAHLLRTVKTRLDDTFVMCHPVLKWRSKARRRRETSSSPQVTKASLPLPDLPHRQETASSATHTSAHTPHCHSSGVTAPAVPCGGWWGQSPRSAAGVLQPCTTLEIPSGSPSRTRVGGFTPTSQVPPKSGDIHCPARGAAPTRVPVPEL